MDPTDRKEEKAQGEGGLCCVTPGSRKGQQAEKKSGFVFLTSVASFEFSVVSLVFKYLCSRGAAIKLQCSWVVEE